MHAHSTSVQRMLALLHQQLNSCESASFNELALVNGFYGLQNMSSDVAEVRQVLNALTDKLTQWASAAPVRSPPRGVRSPQVVPSCILLVAVSGMDYPTPKEVLAEGWPRTYSRVQGKLQLGACVAWLPGKEARRGDRYEFRAAKRNGPRRRIPDWVKPWRAL